MNNEVRKNGTFWTGIGLIGCGLADGVLNPFAFITAPKLIGSGIALIAISQGRKPREDDYE